MDNIIHIRKATYEDCATIVDLGRRTFVETYSEIDSNDALQEYVEQKFSEEKISGELNSPQSSIYIGFMNNEAVAFTKLRHNRVAKGLEHKRAIEIERIYVLKEYQGFKVGKEMMKKCKQIAILKAYECIWLQVWQGNNKAIQFYQKLGFVVYETAIYNYPKGMTQNDFLMRFDLYY